MAWMGGTLLLWVYHGVDQKGSIPVAFWLAPRRAGSFVRLESCVYSTESLSFPWKRVKEKKIQVTRRQKSLGTGTPSRGSVYHLHDPLREPASQLSFPPPSSPSIAMEPWVMDGRLLQARQDT
ncbi:hypothetical protein B0J15DRAFT_294935 [Fusarium solani]|jgi:hypothetical protein|uniref:Uncharacterized protein n=1 Tax=Fusarium solani TaxID=169388 RepID=A0A9P9HIL9_FUSSL|nr:uncharacterized protein B0J15DRAFT_294935 [Fusarium solani]KAH7258260.1 hypothetical protein B0J15DRAFT_294935 [Fusarium solani]